MAEDLILTHLAPDPEEEWQRMLRFTGLDQSDRHAMVQTIEALMERSAELVVNTYEYLRTVPETAAILGWEQDIDQAHLQERRRFFSVWLSRTLGIDTSNEFANYLFRAGQYHAGHGPRHIHTPPSYVTGSIGLVLASFARIMNESDLPAQIISSGMAGWSKYLTVQLNQMLFGYSIATEYVRGDYHIPVGLFGKVRPIVGEKQIYIAASPGDDIEVVLSKFFNYYPQTRSIALDRVWRSEEKNDSLWVNVKSTYIPLRGWRFLINGREVSFVNGFTTPIHEKDKIDIFPPGR